MLVQFVVWGRLYHTIVPGKFRLSGSQLGPDGMCVGHMDADGSGSNLIFKALYDNPTQTLIADKHTDSSVP